MKRFISKLPYLLGLIALLLLLPKLPGVAAIFPFLGCPKCLTALALLAMMGGGYFAGLMALMYFVPTFPSRTTAILGVIWAIALGLTLYFATGVFCIYCFFAHLCHIGMWLCFVIYPRMGGHLPLRKCMGAVQIGIVVFLGYFLLNEALLESIEEEGERAPPFRLETVEGGSFSRSNLSQYKYVVLNFIRPDCGFCRQQIVHLDGLVSQYESKKIRFFNLVEKSEGVEEVKRLAPHIEIARYTGGDLLERFDVRTFPTLFVIDKRGTIVKEIAGASSSLEAELRETLK